jgi:membrane protease YdiL (CAAX protease family)
LAPQRAAWVWVALLSPPLVLGVCFAPAVLFVSARNPGLSGDALNAAVQAIAPFPATLGFLAVFALTRWLAKGAGLSLSALGWRKPTAVDLAIGAGLALVLAALNTAFVFPLLHQLRPAFDPSLAAVPLPLVLLMLPVAAVAEDTLYRGYGFEVLRARHGVAVAVGATSLTYAVLAPQGGLPLNAWAAAFGLLLAGLKLWRGNLWPVLMVHAAVAVAPKVVQ